VRITFELAMCGGGTGSEMLYWKSSLVLRSNELIPAPGRLEPRSGGPVPSGTTFELNYQTTEPTVAVLRVQAYAVLPDGRLLDKGYGNGIILTVTPAVSLTSRSIFFDRLQSDPVEFATEHSSKFPRLCESRLALWEGP
jgi:hypothetical protein